MLIICAAGPACTSSPEAEPLPMDGADAGDVDDVNGEEEDEDVLTIGDVGDPVNSDRRCGDAVIVEWPLNNAVTTGEVITEEMGDYRQMTIDATAGGMQGASENPFVYVRLDTGERVDVTDIDALDDDTWDLAFKRIVIRTNSEDSGPGSVRVNKQSETTFEDVVDIPSHEDPFMTDLSFNEDCEPIIDSIGNLFTAFNHLNPFNASGSQSWYDYGSGGAVTIGPVEGDIYVVHNQDRDEYYKVEISAWSSGEFTLRWALLTN